MLKAMQGKHVHIFEYERKGRLFTGLIVCTACGFYLSSQDRPSAPDKDAPKAETQREV